MKKIFLNMSLACFTGLQGWLTMLFLLLCLSPNFAQVQFVEHPLDYPSTMSIGQISLLVVIDLDGDEDLVGPEINGADLLIYRNQNGTIDTVPQRIRTALERTYLEPCDFLLTDWNLDGFQDGILLRADYTIYLFINEGGLSFAQPVLLTTQYWQPGADYGIKDLNQDNYPDFYLVSGTVKMYLNNNGAPAATLVIASLLGTEPVTIGFQEGTFFDYNGDQMEDFVGVSIWGSSVSYANLILFRNIGNNQFQIADTLAGYLWLHARVADLNADGRDEVIYGTDSTLHIRSWNPNLHAWEEHLIGTPIYGTWQPGSHYEYRFKYPITDIDGNGFPDIVLSNSVFFNQGNFQFTKVKLDEQSNFELPYFSVGDPDLNGKKEIWWTSEYTGLPHRKHECYRIEYADNQTFSAREKMWRMLPCSDGFFFDANGDADIDFVYFNWDMLVVSINHNGVFTEHLTRHPFFYVSGTYEIPSYGGSFYDIDNDGLLDLRGWGGQWAKNMGDGTFQAQVSVDFPGLPSNKFLHERHDFDNDGLKDLLVEGDDLQTFELYKNLSGNYQFVDVQSSEEEIRYMRRQILDLNGDGFDDLFLYNRTTKSYSVYINKQGNGFEWAQTKKLLGGNQQVFFGLADVTSDGIKDLIFTTIIYNFPEEYATYCYPSIGDGTFGNAILLDNRYHGGSSEESFGIFDVNLDGLDDLIFSGTDVSYNTGNGFGTSIKQAGINTSWSMNAMDMDKDGDLDFPFHRTEGYWENTTIGSGRIFGNVFFDKNGNGLQDVGENPASNLKLILDGLSTYAISDSSGTFSMPTGANSGAFMVSVLSPFNANFEFTTPYPAQAAVSMSQPNDTISIGLRITYGAFAQLDQVLTSHRCNEIARLWLSFSPIAAGPMNGELHLKFPAGVSLQDLDSLSGVQVFADEIVWNLSQMPSLGEQKLWANFKMPDYQSSGDTLTFEASLQLWEGTDSVLVRDSLFTILTCAYDPNDKQIADIERFLVGDEYFTTTVPERVEYLIRFQNTGNDTASIVQILDNLNPAFDFASFKKISSSHPCQVNLGPIGLLRVEFPDIALPDSAANFLGSMGFFKFSIALKPDPPRSKPIVNRARILFDQNPPVLTNPARLNIVDCEYFVQGIQHSPGIICQGDSVLFSIPNHGLQQQYSWTYNGQPIVNATADSAWTVAVGTYSTIGLTVNNAICQAQDSAYFSTNGAYPDLQLNYDGSELDFCAGVPLYLESNIAATWYLNDTLVQMGSTDYFADRTQILKVVAQNNSCVTSREIQITEQAMPTQFIEEGSLDVPILRCSGDSVLLSTHLIGNFRWNITNQSTGSVLYSQTSEIGFLIDSIPIASIYIWIDTLNCYLSETRWAYRISDGEMSVYCDSVVCEDANWMYFFTIIDQNVVSFDSLFVYQNDSLILANYARSEAFISAISAGLYKISVASACRRDTFWQRIYNFEDFEADKIVQSNDTLFSGSGNNLDWWFSTTLNEEFYWKTNDSLLSNPEQGYYFGYYNNGNCYGITDTIYYQSSRVSEQQYSAGLKIFPNPNPGVFSVELSEPAAPEMSFRIVGLTGQLLREQFTLTGRTMQTVQAGDLPAGLYFLQVVSKGMALAVEKFVKQ